ncbi:MAG: acyl-CoA desaturase [Lewinellaceae bacterium]|nr:acyl-CoA desaturase [Lewinellaceae bacterium]
MAGLAPIRFISKDKNQFYKILTARVDAYFIENNISKHANSTIVLKTILLVSGYLLPLVAMLIWQINLPWSLPLWILMGISMAGIGMSVMHDAIHGAYAANTKVNNWMGYSLFLLGGSITTWKLQHNNLHHNFTNIVHYDEDIDDKVILRLSPHTELKGIHKFQWLFAILLYSLVTLYWVTAKDFVQFARYTRKKVNRDTPTQNRKTVLGMVIVKIAYFSVMIGLPLIAGLSIASVFVGFLVMHAIAGVILTVIFQLAHTVEETKFPVPDENGRIENDWAIHQMETTVNFSRRNRLLSWYVGGLNFQVEHHLFPSICHIHYPKIAGIVEQTAKEFNVSYLEHKTFWHALRSHFSVLHKFGWFKVLNEAIG